MELRQLTFDELGEVLVLQKAGFKKLFDYYQDKETSPYFEELPTLQRKFNQKNSFYFFVLEAEETIGFVRIVFNDKQDKGRVSPLVIKEAFQGKGFGKQAMLHLESQFKQVKEWHLDTILQETTLVNFYLGLGYEPTGELETLRPGMALTFLCKKIG